METHLFIDEDIEPKIKKLCFTVFW
jgi:hypothetical protein